MSPSSFGRLSCLYARLRLDLLIQTPLETGLQDNYDLFNKTAVLATQKFFYYFAGLATPINILPHEVFEFKTAEFYCPASPMS